ncbi:MAG: tryptophan 7-halogenase [Myxococcales bacterium]|nr:tryptophan 7-halogenase [Myxococcales bacterium]
MTDTVEKLDIAILGGGLAGNLVARQLSLRLPNASIGLFEKDTERGYKVGESSVEIASNFFIRKLGLSTYMVDDQLPKNGLRFFFDTKEKNASLFEMSEVGSDRLPMFPTFQIDRARFERDLLEMNRGTGVKVAIGGTIKNLDLKAGIDDATTHRHSFEVHEPDGSLRKVRARWIVDASGRQQLISKLRGFRTPERHACGSVWGRFTNVTDMDSLMEPKWPGADAWKGRARHTARVLSTNHFCYKGYWIWFIPIARGITSLGVVGTVFEPWMSSEEGFFKFMRQHKAVASLLEDAKCIDVIGEAAAFSDPFYSPGSDYISIESDMITDMIVRELGGLHREARGPGSLYDEFMKFRFDATMLLYRDQYPVLGSYETMRLKWNFDISCYYNLWVDFFMRDHHLDPRKLREQLRRKEYVLQALENFSNLFQKLVVELEAKDQLHRSNLGHYNNGTDLLYFQSEIGVERKKGAVNTRTEEIFNFCLEEARRILGEGAAEKLELHRFMEPVSLA